MVDLRAFARKTLTNARNDSITGALTASGLEVAGWITRRLTDREFGRTLWDDDEWTIALILDACRYDVYQQEIRVNAPSALSVGSASPEWIGRTFAPQYADEFADVAYISGNPFTNKPNERTAAAPPGSVPLEDSNLAYLDAVYEDTWGVDVNGGYIDVVGPETMTKRALWAWDNRDELGFERMVIHYMQPHIPFRMYPDWFATRKDLDYFGEPDAPYKIKSKDPWKRVRDGELDAGEFWNAYRDNLRWVWDEGVEIIGRATGEPMLVTSDHGNGMGEWGVWSHPTEHPAPVLRRVPWDHVKRGQTLTDYDTEAPPESAEYDVKSRLADLGYL